MAIIATVGNDPIAAISNARQTGNMTNHFHKGALLRIGGVTSKVRPVNIATLRDHQNVNGRLWIDILEGQRVGSSAIFLQGSSPRRIRANIFD